MCFCRHGETQSNSQASITRSGELLIKWWKRLRIPWEADNGGSGVFLWYPEQQALGNQVQLNSHTHTHTPLFGKHLAREVPILIKGCMLVWCMFLLMTCFFPNVVSMYGPVNFPAVWAQLCVLCVHVYCLISCCFFQVSLVLLLFNQSWGPCHGRKETLFEEVAVWYCAAGVAVVSVPIGNLFIWGKGKPPFPSLVIPESSDCRILSWIGGVVFNVFILCPVIDILSMDVTEIHTDYSPWLNTLA